MNTLALGTLSLLSAVNAANAQYTFSPNDATVNYDVGGDAIVGFANISDYHNFKNGTSPAIDFVSGGVANSVLIFNGSKFSVDGGRINTNLISIGINSIYFTNGYVESLVHVG